MKTVLLALLVIGCGSSEKQPKPFVVLDEPAKSPTPTAAPESAPVQEEPAAEEPMPPEPTGQLSSDELEKSVPVKGTGQIAIAVKLNNEAIALVKKSKFAEASAKFRDAVARVPQAPYFYNLCFSLYQEGKFGEALLSCNAVEQNEPTPAIKAKTEKLNAHIRWESKRQGITVKP